MRTNLRAAEAQRVVLDAVAPLAAETCTTADAHGRVLAEPVASRRTLPPFDVSAMDGYAVRSADLAGGAIALPVVFEMAAGAVPDRRLEPGQAGRLFTRAPPPPRPAARVPQRGGPPAGSSRARRRASSPARRFRPAPTPSCVRRTSRPPTAACASRPRCRPARTGGPPARTSAPGRSVSSP